MSPERRGRPFTEQEQQEQQELNDKVRPYGQDLAKFFPRMHGSVKILIKDGFYAGYELVRRGRP